MKVLFLCSETIGKIAPFVEEQANEIRVLGHQVKILGIRGKGIRGYLSALVPLSRSIQKFKPDIIHAHYGLSGLLANFQRKVPVVTTFHGSDINNKWVSIFSNFAFRLSRSSIFVSSEMANKMPFKKNKSIIPCGVDLTVFNLENITRVKQDTLMDKNHYNILFSSSFDMPVKNYALAKSACLKAEFILEKKINLIELKGYNRNMVAKMMNAADCLLLTSFSEGSPQFVKEGMALGKSIVATNVGDVEILFRNVKGCFITQSDVSSVADKIVQALQFSVLGIKTSGLERIKGLGLDSKSVAKQIETVYKNSLKTIL
jgi:teichuronic acid biosynthesis glycosyltransferase TuaC